MTKHGISLMKATAARAAPPACRAARGGVRRRDERNKMKQLILILLVNLLVACNAYVEPAQQKIPENESAQWTFLGRFPSSNGLYRYIDSESNVVCWLAEDEDGRGISCLPINQTTLK